MQHVHYYLTEGPSSSGLTSPFRWRSLPLSDLPGNSADAVFDHEDALQPLHPLFVIPHDAAQKLRDWSESQKREWSADHPTSNSQIE